MSKDLLKVVKVACFDIHIKSWGQKEAINQNMFGRFACFDQTIYIDEGLSDIKYVDTLLHELNHAIYWAYGIDDEDKEERIVGTFATAWTQVFRDNPVLLKIIESNLHE